MAQADGSCANASGSAFRSDLNNQLAALFTTSSGATAPATTFAYQLWADTTANVLKMRNSSNTGWNTLRGLDGSLTGSIAVDAGSVSAPSLTFGSDGPDHGFYRYGAGEVAYVTQSSGADHTLFSIGKEITNDGRCLMWGQQVGATSASQNAANTDTLTGIQVQQLGRINICYDGGPGLKINRLNSFGSVVQFHYDGSQAGRIGIISGSDVSLIDSSDRRLKDNITDMPEAKSRINQIQMHRFRMIATDTYEEGFIAQELKEVVPTAVLGSETDIDDEGNIEYMGVGKDMLVPLLTKGLQEAFAEIAALTARVEALEAG
jgi:hypothetical protein